MEFYCDLEVRDRIVYHPSRRLDRTVSSPAVIAVGRLSMAKGRGGIAEIAVAVYTPESRSGTIYNMENLCEICTKFVTEGKVTLRFDYPPHDLRIKSYPLKLDTFLEALKSLKEGNGGEKRSPMKPPSSSPLETTSFPSSLRILQATDCSVLYVDSQILSLKQLQFLNLSYNVILDVPPALGRMSRLTELSLNRNYLRALPAELFSEGMFPALVYLNLSENLLTSIPSGLATLSKLQTLHLDGNGLGQLPSDIGDLSRLRMLTISQNSLRFLPGSFMRLHLECLDLSDNPFQERFQLFAPERAYPTLQELSAITILEHKLRVQDDDIPRCFKEYLKTSMKCSLCSSVFFKPLIEVTCAFDLRAIGPCIYFPIDSQGGDRVKVPFRFKLCSTKCCVAFRAELEVQL